MEGNQQTLNNKKKKKKKKFEEKLQKEILRIFTRTPYSSQLVFIISDAQSVITMSKKKKIIKKPRESSGEHDGGDISLSQHHL